MKFRVNVCQICLKAHLLPLGAVDPRVGCQLGFAWRSVARSIASSPQIFAKLTLWRHQLIEAAPDEKPADLSFHQASISLVRHVV